MTTKPILPRSPKPKRSRSLEKSLKAKSKPITRKRTYDNSDVLISAVISPYLLTHLHHVLQRAEYGADKQGLAAQAANFAQLRKVLCMDARSIKDAFALGMADGDLEKFQDSNFDQKVA